MAFSTFINFFKKNPAAYVLFLLALLCLIGVTMISSSSFFYGKRYWGNPYYFTIRHVVHLMVGMVVLLMGTLYPYNKYKKLTPFLMIASFLLLFLVLFPGIGVKAGNARRWIRFNGFGFQPSELLKFTLIVWLSGFLDRKKEVLGYFSKGIFPLLLVMGVYISLLVLQPDFGMAMLISMTLFIMLFVAGAKPTHMIISITGLAGVAVMLIQAKAYRLRRLIFWDPWADPLDAGYQLIQSFIAFGTGGIFGKGLGNSQQKIFFLPEGHTDFIFSILAEEVGLIGVLVVLVLIILLMKKGFEISCSCNSEFGQNLAFGITLLITLQSILHIGVVIGLLPTKGIPLPFISYGGTSLILNMFLVGVLINIAKEKISR